MLKRKGQSTVEFTILIIIVIGAFIGIGTYFKRGIQGRWKAAVDDMGDQYDPRMTNADITFKVIANNDTSLTITDAPGGYWTTRTDRTESTEIKTGFLRVLASP